MATFKIDRLQIRMKGVYASTAKEVTSGLGAEIMQQLSQQGIFNYRNLNSNIGNITCDPIKSERRNSASSLRKTIANNVSNSVVAEARGKK